MPILMPWKGDDRQMRGLKAVFLDRDGTIIQNMGFLGDSGLARIIPGVPETLLMLKSIGFSLIVVTNQSGVAKGLFSLDQVDRVNRRIQQMLAESGAMIDGWYVCPHHPEGCVIPYRCECDCRKPRAGLLLRAAAEHSIDAGSSFMVGDDERDALAGRAAGCRTVRLASGPVQTCADTICRDLSEAGLWIAGGANSSDVGRSPY